MRQLPIDVTTIKETKVTHLFEIELAVITVLAKISSTKYIIDDIDKCVTGIYVSKAYSEGNYIKFDIRKIIAIDVLTNQITLESAFTVDAVENTILCETLHTTGTAPLIDTTNGKEFLQLYHAALGTLTGKITLTDFDLPIVTEVDRATLFNTTKYNGCVVYLPISIFYNGVDQDDKGKMSSVELAVSNVDQYLGNLMLTHNALKERSIVVKNVYMSNGDCDQYSTIMPINDLIQVSVTDGSYNPVLTYNDSFTNFMYVPAINAVTEFEGSVDTSSCDNKTLSLQATVIIDSTENIVLPTRMYNRLRCPFIYKSWRCRFNSKLILNANITAEQTGMIEFKSSNLFFYFKNIQAGETHILRIGEELIVIDGFEVVEGIAPLDNEDVRKLSYTQVASKISSNENRFKLHILTRGYGDTTKTTHAINDSVDVLMCKKTDHDCMLHGHDAYFGAFPAIPKNKNYAG